MRAVRAALLAVLLGFAVLAAEGPAAAADVPAAAARPTPEQVDAAIASLSEELRRAGSADRQQALTARLADAWVVRARLHLERGEHERALDAYDRALALAPTHGRALVEGGWVHLQSGQPERARGLAETALAQDINNPRARELRGEIMYRDERLDDALLDFELAARGLPDDTELAVESPDSALDRVCQETGCLPLTRVWRNRSARPAYPRTLGRT